MVERLQMITKRIEKVGQAYGIDQVPKLANFNGNLKFGNVDTCRVSRLTTIHQHRHTKNFEVHLKNMLRKNRVCFNSY